MVLMPCLLGGGLVLGALQSNRDTVRDTVRYYSFRPSIRPSACLPNFRLAHAALSHSLSAL